MPDWSSRLRNHLEFGLARTMCPVCGKTRYQSNMALHCRSNPGHLETLKNLYEEEIRGLERLILDPEPETRGPSEIEITREIIRALGQGQPPSYGTLRITVDRERPLDLIRDLLQRGQSGTTPGALFLLGDPGSGKSHLMNCARDLAADANLLVFQTEVVESGARPREEQAFCRALFKGVRFPGMITARGRRDILVRLALREAEAEARRVAKKSLGTEVVSGEQFLFLIHRALARTDVDHSAFLDLVRQWIDGMISGGSFESELPLMSLNRFEKAAVSLAESLGMKGCVFLVDELEEARDGGSYKVLVDLLSADTARAAWIFAANHDLLSDAQNGIAAVNPELDKIVRGHSVDLEPMNQNQLCELARKVEVSFTTARFGGPKELLEDEEIEAIVRDALRGRRATREIIAAILRSMQRKSQSTS